MPDGRRNNGGHKTAGRKPKAKEQELIEKLSPMEPLAMDALETALKRGHNWAVKLYMEYRYGKPKENININPDNDFNIPVIKFFGED